MSDYQAESEFRKVKATATFVRDDVETGDGGDGEPYAWFHRVWKVLLRTEGRRMTVPYMTGMSHPDPTAEDVLETLVMDASHVDNSQDLREWATELGFDPNSRHAERTYRATVRQAERLRRLLGDRYDEFLALEF